MFTGTIPLYQTALQGQVSIYVLKVSGWCTYKVLGVSIILPLVALFKACGAERYPIYKDLVKITFDYQAAEYDLTRLEQILMKNWIIMKYRQQ